jgi:hypothetical protein
MLTSIRVDDMFCGTFLDDVDYLVEDVVCNPYYQFNVLICISCHHGIPLHLMHRLYVYLCNYIIQDHRRSRR